MKLGYFVQLGIGASLKCVVGGIQKGSNHVLEIRELKYLIMNHGSIIVPAMEVSLQMPRGFCCYPKSDAELNEQSDVAIPTSKSIPINTLKSDTLQKSRGIASDKELCGEIELLNEFIKLHFSDPNKSKFALFDIKAECEAFLNEFDIIPQNKELIVALKLHIEHYQQFCIEEMAKSDLLEETLDILLNNVYGFPSEDKLITGEVEKINEFREHFYASKSGLKSLFQEVEVLLVSMLRKLPDIETSENNTEDAGFINEKESITFEEINL